MSRHLRRRVLLATAAAAAAVALPAAAQANNVLLSQGELGYYQTTNQPSSVVVKNGNGTVNVESGSGITSFPSQCSRVNAFEVACPAGLVLRAYVQLNNGNDFYTSNTHIPTTVLGLAGNDTYAGAVHPLINRVDFDGGAGSDTVTYLLSSRGVSVNKDEAANDGRFQLDQDNIRTDVERVVGSRHRDILTGSDLATITELYFPGQGDDVVNGNGGADSVLAEPTIDGADFFQGGNGVDRMSYTNRTRPVSVTPGIATPGNTFADDGEAGERDQLASDVEVLIGGQADDTLKVRPGSTAAVSLFGGGGVDTLEAADGPDQLHGGSGGDTLLGNGGDDEISAADGEGDVVGCGFGSDTAILDTLDGFSNCETRRTVGVLRLAPAALVADAGEIARVRLSWRHPEHWRKLRKVELRLTQDELPVGAIVIRPRGERIEAEGDVELVRRATRLTAKGKTVAALLALRLDESLAGRTLHAEVEATDVRGARQLEPAAGAIRVAG